MPRNVKWFAWLWAVSCLMLIPEVLLMPEPGPNALKAGFTRPMYMAVTAGFAILLLLITLPFFWLAVWKRKNWARWLLFVVTIGTLPLLFTPHAFEPNFLPMTSVAFVGAMFGIAAFYFVFTGDARPWFSSKNSN